MAKTTKPRRNSENENKGLLDPKNDVVFKMLFGEEKNIPILKAFLTAVLKPQLPIASLVIKNPGLPRDFLVHKRIQLDVAVTLDDNTQVNVEMQMANHEFFLERMIYYWARRHSQQLTYAESAEYSALRPTVSIIVTKFELFEEPGEEELFHLTAGLMLHQTKRLLTDQLEFHFLELPKAERLLMGRPSEDPVELWVEYMVQPTKETLVKLAAKDPIFDEVNRVMTKFSASERRRYLADARMIGEMDHRQRLSDAVNKTRLEDALGMLEAGISRDLVCKALKMTPQELEALLASAPAPKAG